MIICHTCNNTTCCNHEHLYEGTHKTNSDDMARAGRRKTVRPWLGVTGDVHPRTVYSWAQKMLAVDMYKRGIRTKVIARELGMSPESIRAAWRAYVKAKRIGIIRK
jgi:hypothetical protein